MFALPSPIRIYAPGARAAIETMIALGALLSAGLIGAGFRESRDRADLLLVSALALAGCTDFAFSALPAISGHELLAFGTGAHVACEALVAAAFVAVAVIPRGKLSGMGDRPMLFAVAASMGIVALAALIGMLAGAEGTETASRSGIAAAAQHPVSLIEPIVACCLLVIAGVAFSLRQDRDGWALAGASFMLGAAGLQYLALPAMRADWLTARDGLRLVAYGLLLATAICRYAVTRREIADAAAAQERSRIASDLHDGLAQDLAFIALQSEQLESKLGVDHRVSSAARRALAASRGVIVDLTASAAPNTGAALDQVAQELGARFNVKVSVRIKGDDDASADLDPKQRCEVVRIAREATVNAIKDGGAHDIEVVLDYRPSAPLLQIRDDGCGIVETEMMASRGFGLRMMRNRAAALGGRLVARRRPCGGTELELLVPPDAASAQQSAGSGRVAKHHRLWSSIGHVLESRS